MEIQRRNISQEELGSGEIAADVRRPVWLEAYFSPRPVPSGKGDCIRLEEMGKSTYLDV